MKGSTVVASVILVLLLAAITVLAEVTIVDEQQKAAAYQYGRQYVEHEVAYKLGGRLTVEQYLDALAQGKTPGKEIGVDASAVVVNAYRHALGPIRFRAVEAGETRYYEDVSSSALYHWNSIEISAEQVRPGDLIFFQNAAGHITGVALFSRATEKVVHFIVASQSQGKVVLTNALIEGEFWQNRFAGFRRMTWQ